MKVILWATHLRSLAAVHFELEPGFYQLGRSTPDDPPDKLSVPFDHKLSRRTARIEVKPTRIVVQRAGSKAPLFVEGVEREQFELIPGQRFGVAETVFELAHELGQTITAEELDEARAGQSDQVLETMLKIQPLFKADIPVEELGRQINELLPSSRIALFLADPLQSLGEVTLVPSKSLVAQACQQEEPVYFEWTGGAGDMPTAAQGENWAFAAPIFAGQEKLLLYSVGHRQAGTLERGGLSLLAQMLKNHLEARRAGDLAQAQAALEQLRSNVDPKVREAAEKALRGEGEQAVLKILSLGELEIFAQGERLDKQWGGTQLSWLLSYLASSSKSISEDTVLEDFWPEKSGTAGRNLSVAASRLRKYLQDCLEGDPILRNSIGYAINEELHYWHDYREVKDLLSLILSPRNKLETEQLLEAGKRLLELDRGPYLEGCYLEWAVRRRTELEERLQRAYQAVAEAALGSQCYEDALEFAQRSLKLDPCSQTCHLTSIHALLGLGRPENAVRQFETCQKTLARELGMEPSIELLEAYQRARLSLPY